MFADPPDLAEAWRQRAPDKTPMPTGIDGALELFDRQGWRVRLEVGAPCLAELVDVTRELSHFGHCGPCALEVLLRTYLDAVQAEADAGMALTPQLAPVPTARDGYAAPHRPVDLDEGRAVVEAMCQHFGFAVVERDYTPSGTRVTARWRERYELKIRHAYTASRAKPVFTGSLVRRFSEHLRVLHELPIDEDNSHSGHMEHRDYREFPSLFLKDIRLALDFLGMVDLDGHAYGTVARVKPPEATVAGWGTIETRQSTYGVHFALPAGAEVLPVGTRVRYRCKDATQKVMRRRTPYKAKEVTPLHGLVMADAFLPPNR